MTERPLIQRLESVFDSTFKGKLRFSEDLVSKDNAAWDSLHHVVFMIAIENEFKIKMDGVTAAKLVSISHIVEHVTMRVSQTIGGSPLQG